VELVIPNPNLKLMDPMREAMPLKRDLSTVSRTGITRRHYAEEATLHRAIKIAAGRTGIAKPYPCS
jgi:hypothetical protein